MKLQLLHRRRISADTKLAFADYFDRYQFPSNKTFRRLNSPGHDELGTNVVRFGLKYMQAVRQLSIWKQSKDMIDDYVFSISSEIDISRINNRHAISLG